MVAILFALLGVVALMPFATGLVASAITAPVAMMVSIWFPIVGLAIVAALRFLGR
jgi:uncharacterized membrane protein